MAIRCAVCQGEVPEPHRFCGQCGAAVGTPSQMPTFDAPHDLITPLGARMLSTDAGADGPRFTPGLLFAGRYRIVGLLGRGGMGAVFRADDVKLGQAVALKFLPRSLAADPARLERFLAEVRFARQVSHPNVCRVYDIGDFEGDHFLSMEYVDGEDLRTLLQRIGRLAPDKVLDLAKQIASGLAAAHERGVLHRDLKPANLMLDGRGRVRITDFGLATATDAVPRHDGWGTPAYMAPEQLAGGPASVRSDIYAFGLVLYELYTGKCAFSGRSLEEVRGLKEQDTLPAPSELIGDIDPAIDRLILRMVARDPRARPASVAQVAAALPGGNELEVVLRAGETPSPEMVAASGTSEALAPSIAWTLVAIVIAGSVTAAAMGSKGLLWRQAIPDHGPAVVADRASQLLTALGHNDRPVDRAAGIEVDLDQLRYLQQQNPSTWRILNPEPSFLRFWYRDGPQPLAPWRFPFQYGNVSRLSTTDPPLDAAGMKLVRLDPSGRLTHLVVVPSSMTESRATPQPDWATILTRAGFDASAWQPIPPTRNPPVYADTRVAFEGTWPNAPQLRVRLEAAALEGKAVYFEVVYPWTPPPRTAASLLTATERGGLLAVVGIIAATVVGAAIAARWNLRAGRGDRRGASRLAAFVFGMMMLSWFFGEKHVAALWEVALILMAVSWALATAIFTWVAYLAVEPFLRRRWPEVLISWTRLLGGQFRDPLVGRDLLIGCATGPLLAIVAILQFLIADDLGVESPLVFADVYGTVYDVQAVVPLLLWRAAQAISAGLLTVLLLLVLRLALRSIWIAVFVFVVINTGIATVASGEWVLYPVVTALHALVFAWLIVRYGLLAGLAQFYVWGLFIFFPITTQLDAWYAGAGLTAILVLAALTSFGFMTARGRHPLAPQPI